MREDTKGLTALVPELFFDIIARVVPGAYLLLIAATLLIDPHSALTTFSHAGAGPAIVILLLICALGYSAAMITCRFSDLITKSSRDSWKHVVGLHQNLLVNKLPDVASAFDHISIDAKDIAKFTDEQCDALDCYIQELLKESDPHASLVLAKMQAEYFFCANFATSSLILAVVSLWDYQIGVLRHHVSLSGLALVAFFGILTWAGKVGNSYFGLRRVERQFALLALSKALSGQKTTEHTKAQVAVGSR